MNSALPPFQRGNKTHTAQHRIEITRSLGPAPCLILTVSENGYGKRADVAPAKLAYRRIQIQMFPGEIIWETKLQVAV